MRVSEAQIGELRSFADSVQGSCRSEVIRFAVSFAFSKRAEFLAYMKDRI